MEEEKQKNCKEHGDLKKIKINYEIFHKKYGLPEFSFMNENFEIENIDSEETELFLKRMRKHITEKIFYILRTLEVFLNAQNAPMYMFNIIKSMTSTEKEHITELYKRLAKYEIEAFGLEAKYDEKKEAEFIKKFSIDWKDASEDLIQIYEFMKEGYNKQGKKENKSYLG